MMNEIGETAGRIWQHLEKNGATSLANLKKTVKISDALLNQAIGWLAREDKVILEKKGNSIKISLR